MHSTLSRTTRFSAVFLCALGLWILSGWLIDSEPMVRVVPGSPAMAINTAAMFLVSGICLLLSENQGRRAKLTCQALAAILISLPVAILTQHLFEIDLGVDWASVHAALGDGHAEPGRTAPNACLGFLFAGIVLGLTRKPALGATAYRVAITLATLTFVIGLTAFLGYLLDLETLYRIASYNKMATLTALGMAALGAGTWSLVASHKTRIFGDEYLDAKRITGLAAGLLTVFALATGLAALGILKESYEKAAANSIWQAAQTSARSVSSLLDTNILLSKSASSRPILKSSLLALMANGTDAQAMTNLQSETEDLLDLGFSGVQVLSGENALLSSSGELIAGQAMVAAPVGSPDEKEFLFWKDGFHFKSAYDVIHENKVIGRILTERRLSEFSAFMKEAQEVAQSSDLVLCARDKSEISCFPSRFYKDNIRLPLTSPGRTPTFPVERALRGETGATSAKDLRGISVIAGYVPLAKHQLVLIEKIDASELYIPLREKLPYLLAAVILFIVIGTMMLRKWVNPLIAKIESERQRMQAILNNSNDAFVAINSNGIVSDWNIEAERVLGWSSKEAIGNDLSTLIVPKGQRTEHNAGFQQFLAPDGGLVINRRIEVRAVHKNGKEIPIELSVAPFHDGTGYAASAFLRDLTAQHEAESELERMRSALAHSQKLEAVGKLTGGIAHDFNNVLQIVKGSLQLLQVENDESFKVQKRVTTAASAVDRGAKLSSQLLSFARKQPLQPRVINLGRVARDMNDMLQRAIGESIEIETVIAGGLWNAYTDPGQLEHVILNMALNARDAMAGEGKLTIEVGNAMLDDEYVKCEPGLKAGQYVMLALSDTGCGMAPETMERAFEPFFTTKREGEGTGLGLSMAYGFVKQSEGHIKIYSEVGHGTAIKIYLPRSFGKEQEVPTPSATAVHGGNETILVVEDDLAVQDTAVELLSGLGYNVLRADHAEMALDVLNGGAIVDLLFTDVVMPGPIRSPELAKQAKELWPGIKVLFTSGYTQNAIVHGGRLDPGVHLLSKPYGRDQLARKIRELLSDSPQAPAQETAHATTHATAQAATQASDSRSIADLPDATNKNPTALRIAFVEDNEDFRELGTELMSLIGHEVESFANAEDALTGLSTRAFDILLTDVSLPGMSGIALAEATVRNYPHIRVVLASGFGNATPEGSDFRFEVLTKPFTLEQLQNVLNPTGEEAA